MGEWTSLEKALKGAWMQIIIFLVLWSLVSPNQGTQNHVGQFQNRFKCRAQREQSFLDQEGSTSRRSWETQGFKCIRRRRGIGHCLLQVMRLFRRLLTWLPVFWPRRQYQS